MRRILDGLLLGICQARKHSRIPIFLFFVFVFDVKERFLNLLFLLSSSESCPAVRFLALLLFHPHQLASYKEASQNQLFSRD